MRATLSIFSIFRLTFFFTSSVLAQYPKSPKRGLVSVSTLNPGDDQIFVQPNNGLTWYYNYGISPTTEYKNLTQSEIEFVPMLWGISNATGSTFLQNVTSMIAKGRNITHVLGFNEPDVNYTAGGSQISPDAAAASWILNFDPLRKMGVKVGAPVVYANESGFAWLDKFYTACQSRKSNCTADFMNIHCFGNISFVESYLTEYKQKYPGIPLWITEFALPYSPLPATETFFNQSLAFFDNDTTVERYSYFGSFRASASNVGWNVTMLDGTGGLTDIGSWYLGGAGVEDASTTTPSAAGSTSSAKKSDAAGLSRGGIKMVGGLVIGATAALALLL
ncbi:glycoside hydrolase family 128 protein [Hyaloscypha variabilis F]|uniref:Glycoside hydrolase family 128 protein n=1 Tax=Hyaloscypha variabilis (strain UAMH 11265 / GT02V1 / F) TaxID=1149755 RepID=A0A2J6RGP5_HYAVF|nr:glycoside hydrolase family 128 protein [Hyaloscypha variabilis F]